METNQCGASACGQYPASGCSVYAIKAYGSYGGGMAIVAATSEAEAKGLATGLDMQWCTRYHEPESVELLPVSYAGTPRVLANYETGE